MVERTMISPVEPFLFFLRIYGLLPSASPKKSWFHRAFRWLRCALALSAIFAAAAAEVCTVYYDILRRNGTKLDILTLLYDSRWAVERASTLIVAVLVVLKSGQIIAIKSDVIHGFQSEKNSEGKAKKRLVYIVGVIYLVHLVTQPLPSLFLALKSLLGDGSMTWFPNVPAMIDFHREFPISYNLMAWYCLATGKLVVASVTGVACVAIYSANFIMKNYATAEKPSLKMLPIIQRANLVDTILFKKDLQQFRLKCEHLSDMYTLLNRAFSSILTLVVLTNMATYTMDLSKIFDPHDTKSSKFIVTTFHEATGFLVDMLVIYASVCSTEQVREYYWDEMVSRFTVRQKPIWKVPF